MFKRIAALMICVLCLGTSMASADSIPGRLFFQQGKDALLLLANDKTEDALSLLNFDYREGDSDDLFKQFLTAYLPNLSPDTVQTDVAVCYWETLTGQWLLAIPVSEPVNDDIMTFVLLSDDLLTFTGYAALTWGEVNEGTASTDRVWWNTEYEAGSTALYAD